MRREIIQICFEAAEKFFNFRNSPLQKFDKNAQNQKSDFFIHENRMLKDDEIFSKIAGKFSITLVILEPNFRKTEFGKGKDFFILIKNDSFFYHDNGGRLTKLPAGVGKLENPKHRLDHIMSLCFDRKIKCRTCPLKFGCNFERLERKLGVRFEIWSKSRKNAKIEIKKIKNSNNSENLPLVRLHYDPMIERYFLIRNDALYFRGFLRKFRRELLI